MFAVELFPTALRNTGYGLAVSASRIGNVLGPQLKLLYVASPLGPFIVYAVFSVATSILIWLVLPETKNRPLPDMPGDDGMTKNNEKRAKVALASNGNSDLEDVM